MKRKVIQLAHKTLVVSLPSKWARKYGVLKGGELEVEERGQQVVFSTAARTESEKIRIDASKIDGQVLRRWVLASLHQTGYDEIEVLYADSETLDIIQDTIKEMLIGFAIVEQGKNRCVIRIVAEEQEKEFEPMLRRAFLVTKSMGDGIYEYLQEGKLARLKDLLALERTNNQLTNFCERILNKKGYGDDKKRCFAYIIAWNLEKLCDHYKKICEHLSGSKSAKLRKEVIEMVKGANDFFGSYYELFYKFEFVKLSELARQKAAFSKKTIALLKGSSSAEAIVLCTLDEFVTKASDFSAAMIALNTRTS